MRILWPKDVYLSQRVVLLLFVSYASAGSKGRKLYTYIFYYIVVATMCFVGGANCRTKQYICIPMCIIM